MHGNLVPMGGYFIYRHVRPSQLSLMAVVQLDRRGGARGGLKALLLSISSNGLRCYGIIVLFMRTAFC